MAKLKSIPCQCCTAGIARGGSTCGICEGTGKIYFVSFLKHRLEAEALTTEVLSLRRKLKRLELRLAA